MMNYKQTSYNVSVFKPQKISFLLIGFMVSFNSLIHTESLTHDSHLQSENVLAAYQNDSSNTTSSALKSRSAAKQDKLPINWLRVLLCARNVRNSALVTGGIVFSTLSVFTALSGCSSWEVSRYPDRYPDPSGVDRSITYTPQENLSHAIKFGVVSAVSAALATACFTKLRKSLQRNKNQLKDPMQQTKKLQTQLDEMKQQVNMQEQSLKHNNS